MTLGRRWSQHTTSKKNSPMYNAFRKYGVENFTLETLCSALSPEHLNDLEQFFIGYYNCMAPLGYNLTSGGDSAYSRSEHSRALNSASMQGHSVSEETRQKISASLMGRPGVRLGSKHSESARKKISEAQIGRKLSKETRAKMSATHKARLAKDSTRSPAQLEALKKVHEGCKGRIPWNKGLKKAA